MTVPDSAAPKPDRPTLPTGAEFERMRVGLRIIALRALDDPDAADEAVQETLSRAVVALAEGRMEDPAKLLAYVAGIARHVCLHLVRDRKNTVPIDDSDGSTAAAHPQLRTESDPLAALISAAESERLAAAFRALPAADQHLLRLCYHEDRTPAEIAAQLGEPSDRVRKRKERVLERLRRAFLGGAQGHKKPASGTESVAPLMSTDPRRSDDG